MRSWFPSIVLVPIPFPLDQVLPSLFSLSPAPNILNLKILGSSNLELPICGSNSQREGAPLRGSPPCWCLALLGFGCMVISSMVRTRVLRELYLKSRYPIYQNALEDRF